MVSFDGFRHDYVDRFNLPNFKRFIEQGAAAEGLIPSFPSKTFPNHYTLVTGLYPGHHGLVDNQFYDAARNKLYDMHDRQSVRDSSFYAGTPLWRLAQHQGLKTASLFWAGSEAPSYPNYYLEYDENMDNAKRVEQVLDWLKLPEEVRPQFLTLYFSLVDATGHDYGPNSAELEKAVIEADRLLGLLVDGLEELSFGVNILVVSDHGMAELKADSSTFIVLPDLLPMKDTTIKVVSGSTQAHIYCAGCDSLYSQLKSFEKQHSFRILRRGDFPESWHYNSPLVGDMLVVADPGHYITTSRKALDKIAATGGGRTFGAHGYDPNETNDMMGILYAKGPAIRPGVTISAIENVDVYPLVAHLLGLKTPPIDGKIDSIRRILK
jgi:alkaline phosphatase D